jgi:hypothetical protein
MFNVPTTIFVSLFGYLLQHVPGQVPTSQINQNSQTRRANQATRTKSSNRYEDRKMKLRRNEGERKTAKPNLAKQIVCLRYKSLDFAF